MSKRVSIVIATYNRGKLLHDLLHDLEAQTFDHDQFEVIVIDDGSKEPVKPHLDALSLSYRLMVIEQSNAGPAAARHRGVLEAQGEIVIITDDDMRIVPEFIAEHVNSHDAGATVVLGQICTSANIAAMPVFERFHAYQLETFVKGVVQGKTLVHGVHVCTGNVSFRRSAYLDVGGFDRNLARSEDRELGVRLQKAGAVLQFNPAARVIHESDHHDLQVWLKRGLNYGIYDARISAKHPDLERCDPWRFLSLVSPVSRPLLLVSVFAPWLGYGLARTAIYAAIVCDKIGLRRAATMATTLCYGLEYFRGVRVNAGSLSAALKSWRIYRNKRTLAAPSAWRVFVNSVRGDYGSTQRYRQKYHGEKIPLSRMPVDMVRKIGFQMCTAIRVMQFCRNAKLPVLPQIVSRMIRYMYSAEIHWDAQIAPGISIVHGNGLVVSHAARISSGCILFQNVTLGEGIDAVTRAIGGPHLEEDVHVGPGATLLGPIVVGRGTKIMAGAIVCESVPPGSVVRPPLSSIVARQTATNLLEERVAE